MKNIKKLILFITMIIAFSGFNIYAATVGEQLLLPEESWKRYDDNAPEITYINCDTFRYKSTTNHYYSGISKSSNLIPEIKFKFYGTKIRFIGTSNTEEHRGNVKIIIDDVEHEFSQIGDSGNMILQFEKLNLSNDVHTVTITRDAIHTGKYMLLGAIDIDNDGYLLSVDSPDAPTNLVATASNSSIALNWDAVIDADSYTILRSTTSSAVDAIIATNITETTYIDNNVTPGVTYYYIVRAVKNGIESAYSNVASAMIESNVATLQIKLSTTDIYEYKATMNDVTNFITWYTDRANGTGLPFYIFPDNLSIEPYTKINEYIIHDKIVWFKVKEYLK